MPRKALVAVEDAVACIEKYIEYFKTATIPKYSSCVWKSMSKELSNAWTYNAVYTNVKENRRNILTIARSNQNIFIDSKPAQPVLLRDECSEESTQDSSAASSNISALFENDGSNEENWYPLLIDASEWALIKPEENAKNLRKNTWTNIIANAFYQQHRLPCAFVFKRANINNSPEALHYLKIEGYCRSTKCGNKFKGIIDINPGNGDQAVVVNVRTRDTRHSDHAEVKRPLNGIDRKKVGKLLKGRSCVTYRKEIAKNDMRMGELEPPHLYSANVLRVAKKSYIDEELGIKKFDSRDIINDIEEMSRTLPYVGMIHSVSSMPFYVFYSSPQQLYAYKEYCRVMKESQISVDATGSVVKKMNRGTKGGHIFLYAIVINSGNTTIAVHNMISEKHDTELIEYWLKQWKRKGAPSPSVAVCDYSKALLSALSLAFNNITIKEYVNRCSEWVNSTPEDARDQTESRPVNTYVRVDVAHLIHLATRWECFKNKRQEYLKKFFVRCIALMIDCNTIKEFERIFVLTCIVAGQTHDDSNLTTSFARTPKDARYILEHFISVRTVTLEKMESMDNPDPEREKLTTGEVCNFINNKEKSLSRTERWIRSLTSAAKANQGLAGVELNAFYLPDLLTCLERIGSEYPLWTNVCVPNSYKHATSSFVEQYFHDLKNRVLREYGKPLVAHKFLRVHISDVLGNCVIFVSKLKKTATIGTKAEESVDDDLLSVEIWKGQTNPTIENYNYHNEKQLSPLKPQPNAIEKITCKTNIPELLDHNYALVNNDKNSCITHDKHKDSLYFKPYPEISVMNQQTTCSNKKLLLLRNGSLTKPTKINSSLVFITGTCGFDSIAQILATAAMDYPAYRSYIESSNIEMLKFVRNFLSMGPTSGIECTRAILLDRLYLKTLDNSKFVCGFLTKDCTDFITNTWKKLFNAEPSINNQFECSECGQKNTSQIPVIPVNFHVIERNGFSSLMESITYNERIVKACPISNCSGTGTEISHVNKQILIELDIRTRLNPNSGLKGCLRDFPLQLKFGVQEYKLFGVVAMKPGHFIAYCRRNSGSWFKCDDLKTKIEFIGPETEITPAGVIYVC